MLVEITSTSTKGAIFGKYSKIDDFWVTAGRQTAQQSYLSQNAPPETQEASADAPNPNKPAAEKK